LDWRCESADDAGPHTRGRPLNSPFEEDERDKANRALILSSFNMRDGEDHARIRTLVNQAFSKASLESKRERIETLAHELLPSAGEGCELDLVSDFGFPLPIQISSEMIGIPSDVRERFRRSFEEAGLLGLPRRNAEQHARGLAALEWQVSLVRSLLEERRHTPATIAPRCRPRSRRSSGTITRTSRPARRAG
jgi:cytochrome P450